MPRARRRCSRARHAAYIQEQVKILRGTRSAGMVRRAHARAPAWRRRYAPEREEGNMPLPRCAYGIQPPRRHVAAPVRARLLWHAGVDDGRHERGTPRKRGESAPPSARTSRQRAPQQEPRSAHKLCFNVSRAPSPSSQANKTVMPYAAMFQTRRATPLGGREE